MLCYRTNPCSSTFSSRGWPQSEAHFSHVQTLLALSRLHALLFPSSSDPSGGFAPPSLPPALASLTAQEVAAVGSLQHALVQRQQVKLAIELAKGESSDVLEGVSFARVLEIIRSLPEPTPEDETPAAPAAGEQSKLNDNRCYQPPIQFGSSSLLDESDPTIPSASTGTTSPNPSSTIQHAMFASGGGVQQKMSFGTAVEASPSPAPAFEQEEEPIVRGTAGLEGEGEALAAVDAEPSPSAGKAEDADVVVERLRAGAGQPAAAASLDWAADEPAAGGTGATGTTTPGGGTRKARGPRGPRNRGPKNSAPADANGGGENGAVPIAAVGDDKPKRTRSTRQPRPAGSNAEGITTGAATAANGVERRRAPRSTRKESGNAQQQGSASGRATPTTKGEQATASNNRRSNGGGNGGRREPTAGGGKGESAGRAPRANIGAGRGGVRAPGAGRGSGGVEGGRPPKSTSTGSVAPALAAPVSGAGQ